MTTIRKQSLRISLGLTIMFIYAISLAQWAFAMDDAMVSVKKDQVIAEDYIRLHHIFDGITAHGDHVLAPTPKAGETLELGLKDLMRISNAFDLDWVAQEANPSIKLRADAQIMKPVMIKQALKESALKEKILGEFRLDLDNPTQEIAVKGRDVVSLVVSDVSYDRISERFSATVSAMRDQETLSTTRVQGEALKVLKIPVLSNRMRRGEVIQAKDLAYVDMLKRDIHSNMLIDKDDLIGTTPRRTINSDQIILNTDVTAPILVKRNDMVDVTLKNGVIQLSTRARAVSEGAKGDVVQIMNPSSKKIIEAIVTGPQKAVIDHSRNG